MDDIRNEMYTACKVADKDKIEACIEKARSVDLPGECESSPGQGHTIEELLNTPFGGEKHTTLLHVACRAGSNNMIPVLLSAGADPTLK